MVAGRRFSPRCLDGVYSHPSSLPRAGFKYTCLERRVCQALEHVAVC